MKTLIIGTGAVGCAVAASAANAGMETAVLARKDTAESIREHGLKRTGIFGDIMIEPGRIAVFSDYDSIDGEYDFIIIAVKTTANDETASRLHAYPHIAGEKGRLILFQNGWGNDEAYLRYFPASRIFHARIITGFERPEPWITKVTVHTAPILLGSLHGEPSGLMEPLAAAIRDSGIPSETSEELEQALWAKMLYNTTLNPLGAILRMTYGELADSAHLKKIMDRLIEETFAVMDAAGYRTFWKDAEAYKETFYGKLVPDTYAHRSSTLQDIEKRRKTEIHTLNGCILDIGKKYGVDTPTHGMIVEMIKGIEDIRC